LRFLNFYYHVANHTPRWLPNSVPIHCPYACNTPSHSSTANTTKQGGYPSLRLCRRFARATSQPKATHTDQAARGHCAGQHRRGSRAQPASLHWACKPQLARTGQSLPNGGLKPLEGTTVQSLQSQYLDRRVDQDSQPLSGARKWPTSGKRSRPPHPCSPPRAWGTPP